MSQRRRIPKYRLHKPSGQAVATLGYRDVYLGRHGTKSSREEYDRRIAEWLANGRRWQPQHDERPAISMNELLLAYAKHAMSYYCKDGKPTTELGHVRCMVRVVRRLYGRELADNFGPLALKACREEFLRAGQKRLTVNQNVGRIKRMMRWAVEHELVGPSAAHALDAVRGLRRGRSEAPESEPVKPVPDEHVDAVLPHLSAAVRAMVELQRLTGMRSGEVVIMRAIDIDRSGPVWLYRPAQHKTQHHGHDRVVPLGPRAQAMLGPFLDRPAPLPLFSPREAEKARNAKRAMTTRHRRRKASRVKRPKRQPRECYDSATYRRAIQRACKKAGIARWHTHQLRHNAATALR
ncbi:MAG: tyrosine-type recombinase/integrase, partial [Deltaproteobacteria bacterium]|nr:tyrosine-type recombinase/integrase [Deltaproteobacteria bacterium]